MKIRATSNIKHHLYPNVQFKIGFNKPPQEWVAYALLCIWKWETHVQIWGEK